jgi:tape measure domain-containing protein
MATLRELIVKIAFKIDDAVLKKSTAKTNEILSKQKKSFEKTEEAITKSKQKEAEKRAKTEQRENEARTRMQMRYLKWKDKEMARHAMLEKKTEQAKSRSFQEGMSNLQSFGTKAIATAAAIKVAFSAVAFAILNVNDKINMGLARVQIATGKNEKASRGDLKRLLGISTGTGTDLEDVLNLYTKLGIARKQLGLSEQQTFQATETIGKLAVMGGREKSAQKGGLLQLTQAFSSDRVQAEEYNSIADALPALNQAIARNLNFQSGAQLQTFIRKGGTITGKELIRAVLKAQEEANKGFEKFPITFDRIKTKFMNSFLQLGLALEDQLEPANRFFQNLYDKMDFLNKFLVKNKEVVGKVIKVVFKTLEKGLDAIILGLDKLQPAMDWLNKHGGTILKIVKDMAPALIAIASAITLLVVGFNLFNGVLKVFQGIMWVLNLDPKIRVFMALAMVVIYLETKFGLLSKTIKATLGLLDQFNTPYENNYSGGGSSRNRLGASQTRKEIMPRITGTSQPLTSNLPKGYSQGQFFQSPTTKNVKITSNNVFNITGSNPKGIAKEVAGILPLTLGGAMQ